MEDKRSKRFWKTRFTFSFLILVILLIFIFSLGSFLVFVKINFVINNILGYTPQWFKEFLVFTVCMLGAITAILVSMYIILYRSVGPLLRMEKVLEQVLSGDYSIRLKIRAKDAIHSLVDKMNQVLDLLEKSKKG